LRAPASRGRSLPLGALADAVQETLRQSGDSQPVLSADQSRRATLVCKRPKPYREDLPDLESLGDALLDFAQRPDLDAWLARHA